MLKNYNKEGQKLPLFGIGPYMIFGMGVVTLMGIVLFGYILKIGVLEAPWIITLKAINSRQAEYMHGSETLCTVAGGLRSRGSLLCGTMYG